ncbi:MAG: chromosome partition protein, partial [Actinomycetota bacterium]
KLRARIFGAGGSIKAGEFMLPKGASSSRILSIIQGDEVLRRFVTIPEGMPSIMVYERLMANSQLTGSIDVPAEGSVLPDTYEIDRGESRAAVLRRMQAAMQSTLAELWAKRSANTVVTTPAAALALAAIVEKETGKPAERRIVAGLYSNRIRQGIMLQADPTIIYPITKGKPLGRRIRQSEIQAVNDYNTYTMIGLPRGPITNPGRASIEAVLLAAEEGAFEREREENGMFASVPSSQASSAAAEVRGELRTLRNTVEQNAGEITRLQARIEHIAQRDNQANSEIDGQQRDLEDAENAVIALREELADLERRRDTAELNIDRTQESVIAAERRHAQRAARVESLMSADAASRARAGSQQLANVPGVVGALIDLVSIESGWDAAVRAALGEAVGAVLVGDTQVARDALSALRRNGNSGAVLALGAVRGAGANLPIGTQSLRPHVSPVAGAPAMLGELLDALLDGIGFAEDIEAAVPVVSASPSAVVVTRRGDRLGRSAWRLGAADDLGSQEVVDDARREETEALADVARLKTEQDSARQEITNVRRLIADTQQRLQRQTEAAEMAADTLTAAINDRRAGSTEQQMSRDAIDEIRGRMAQYTSRVSELEGILPALEENEAAELAAVAAFNEARAAFDSQLAHLSMRRTDLEVRLAGLREREQYLRQRIEEGESKLGANSEARLEAASRRQRIERTIEAIGRLSALVDQHRTSTESRLAELHAIRQRQSDEVRAVAARLDQARRDRHAAEQELEIARERSRRVDVEDAEVRMRLEAAVEQVRRELEVEPEVAEAAPMPDVPEGTTHADRARALERDIRLMGPINPLALQEFTELQQRHEFLEEQLTDVRNTRRELAQVIAAIDQEIQSVFAAAFADVSTNFVELFQLLFPGGKGKLALTNPDDLLNTGIEIEATPPGKTFKKLSLLSGGERSLTAVAFLFAVFRSRPSPFYVMDEVEAALDDVNLHRFLGLVAEFRRDAQLIIVSHQKRTMEAADCLLGVSMQPGGSSKVVTERSSAVTG